MSVSGKRAGLRNTEEEVETEEEEETGTTSVKALVDALKVFARTNPETTSSSLDVEPDPEKVHSALQAAFQEDLLGTRRFNPRDKKEALILAEALSTPVSYTHLTLPTILLV